MAWACSSGTGESEPVRQAGAVDSASPPPPPSAMPTVTVTTTTTPAPAPAAGGPCHEDDLVVTMSADGDAYAASRRPEFRVTVVNAGAGACTFDTGSLDVRITSGTDRIWSSARCRRGKAPKKTLQRGVPYVDNVVWNRGRGCKGGTPVRPGTYVATLKGTDAKKLIFRLH
jgi:hypothetical protein